MRQRKEDGLKKELAELRRIFEIEKQCLKRKIEDLFNYRQELTSKQQSKKIDLNEMPIYHLYFKRMKKEIADQTLKVEAFSRSVEAKRCELLEASKEKKAIEKFRDKKENDYVKLVLNTEQKIIDEIATIRYKVKQS